MACWYYQVGGGHAGPVSWEELCRLAVSGTVRRETLVWTDGWPEWGTAGAVEGLIFAAPDAVPSPSPPPPPTAPPPQTQTSQADRPAQSDPGAAPAAPAPDTPAPTYPYTPRIDNHLAKAILVTIFCCLPLGIVAIVKAAQVNGRVDAGQYAAAERLSREANTWGNWSLIIGLAYVLGWVMLGILAAVTD